MVTTGWLEIHGDNSEEMQTYYSSLLGLPMVPTEMGDHNDYSAMNGETPLFGLIQRYPALEDFRGWLPYFVVEDVTASYAKAIELGGSAVIDPVDAEGNPCSFAVFRDPHGVLTALYQSQ